MRPIGEYTLQELQEEVARREKVKELKSQRPKPLRNPKFDSIIKFIESYMDFIESDDYNEDNDYSRYCYETTISAIYGDKFWEWRRKITN